MPDNDVTAELGLRVLAESEERLLYRCRSRSEGGVCAIDAGVNDVIQTSSAGGDA